MHRTRIPIFIALIAMFAVLLIVSEPVRAGLLTRALSLNGAPQVVSYQGQVSVDGTAYTGSGYFKFAVVSPSGSLTYWTNDGTPNGQPAASVSIPVSKGLFNVLLGDTSLAHMQALPASAFSNPASSLRIWFSSDNATFIQLSPDRQIAAVPYALQAEEAKTAANAANTDTLDGLHASAFQQHYANVLIVAKSGGDFTTLTAALSSITTASSTNAYLIKVMPGIYSEQVTMKSYVDIEGSGERTTKITQPGSASDTTGTVVGAANAELRLLTVENSGGAANAIAIYNAPQLAFVTVNASGGTAMNYAIRYATSMHDVTLTASGGSDAVGMEIDKVPADQALIRDVTITVSGSTGRNTGIQGGSLTLQNATITVSGGQYSYGMYSDAWTLPSLYTQTLIGVTINTSGGTVESHGIHIFHSQATTVRDSVVNATGPSGHNFGVITGPLYGGYSHTLVITGARINGTPTGVAPSGSIMTCANVYDSAYNFYANTCPVDPLP